jgi:uncharacterized Fe-S cluster protein YjdI
VSKEKQEVVIRYDNGEVTVLWRPARCYHSGICARGLPGVFKPSERPWIIMSAADSDSIKAQVERCPSGALAWEASEEKS